MKRFNKVGIGQQIVLDKINEMSGILLVNLSWIFWQFNTVKIAIKFIRLQDSL